jgi:UDP-glucose 4-epimerase
MTKSVNKMRILITGSRGFMGGSVGRLAAQAGHDLLGVSLSSQPERDWTGRHIRADASCANLVPVICEFKPDAVFHAIGPASVPASFKSPTEDFRIALLTWSHLLDCIRRSGHRPWIFFPSSAAVYGNPSKLPVDEQGGIAPISPYGFHKAACELLAREYAECFGLDLVICRFFSIFGAAQRRLIVWELYQQLITAKATVWLEGTGRESRDYLDIQDVGNVFLQLAAKFSRRRHEGACVTINIARGEETRILDLAQTMRDMVAPKKKIRSHGWPRPGDPARWCADVSLLESLLPKWRARPLTQSLAQCLATWSNGTNGRHT